MINTQSNKNLTKKTKRIFSLKYGREISDQEAQEIMQNLLSFMESIARREYN